MKVQGGKIEIRVRTGLRVYLSHVCAQRSEEITLPPFAVRASVKMMVSRKMFKFLILLDYSAAFC